MLFEFEVDVLGRQTLVAVAPIGLAKADAESLRLVEFGGRQQEQHLAVQAGFGPPASQVAKERRPVGGLSGTDRVRFKFVEEQFSIG